MSPQRRSSWVGVVQGIGLGFLFVPLSAATLSTLSAAAARRRRRHLQPVAQHRLERRHFGRQQPADAATRRSTMPTSRRHVTAVNRRFANPAIDAFLEPADRRRPRRARCGDHAAGADHRLYRRLQAADDRDARRDPAADGVPQAGRRPGAELIAEVAE